MFGGSTGVRLTEAESQRPSGSLLRSSDRSALVRKRCAEKKQADPVWSFVGSWPASDVGVAPALLGVMPLEIS